MLQCFINGRADSCSSREFSPKSVWDMEKSLNVFYKKYLIGHSYLGWNNLNINESKKKKKYQKRINDLKAYTKFCSLTFKKMYFRSKRLECIMKIR